MSIEQAIKELKSEMQSEGIIPETGLGNELFLFSSTLAPVINVDLLIINDKKQILLSWRNDPHCGIGWHIPGGCIRFKETIEERIQKTAKVEVGYEVEYSKEPVKIFEIFTKQNRENIIDQRERAHFITLVYKCRLPKESDIECNNKKCGEVGYLKWFDVLPENLLDVQECYRNCWNEICEKCGGIN